MAERTMDADDDILFRVELAYSGYTGYYGPYTDLSVARSRRTKAINDAKKYGYNLQTSIEAVMPEWKEVE